MRHNTAHMDVVYLCRPGANEELRYSLRSLTNIPHSDVYVIGGHPNWFRGNKIRTPQFRTKHHTTNYSMRVACETDTISDPFILFNDDFYVTRPIRGLQDFHRGPIDDVIAAFKNQGIRSRYVLGMGRTRDTLQALGLGTLSYELHIPMVIHKAPMLEALTIGGQRRSIYGNLIKAGGRKIADVKVYNATQPLPTGPFLSSDDTSLKHLLPHLAGWFPEPSPHERPAYTILRNSGKPTLHTLRTRKYAKSPQDAGNPIPEQQHPQHTRH